MSNINIEFNIEDNNWLEYDQNIAKNQSDFLIEISKKTKLQQLQEQNINIEISILLTNKDIKSSSAINKSSAIYRQFSFFLCHIGSK